MVLDLATWLIWQDKSWLKVRFATVMVWLFTIAVLSLPVIMLVSFFYYNYMSSVRHNNTHTARHHGIQRGKSVKTARRVTLLNTILAASAVGAGVGGRRAARGGVERDKDGVSDREMLTIAPSEQLGKNRDESAAEASDSSDAVAAEGGQLDNEASGMFQSMCLSIAEGSKSRSGPRRHAFFISGRDLFEFSSFPSSH